MKTIFNLRWFQTCNTANSYGGWNPFSSDTRHWVDTLLQNPTILISLDVTRPKQHGTLFGTIVQTAIDQMVGTARHPVENWGPRDPHTPRNELPLDQQIS